jgi:hypothetical protein
MLFLFSSIVYFFSSNTNYLNETTFYFIPNAWQTLIEMTRSMLTDSGLGKELWAEAMYTAVYITNRLPTTSLAGDTPFHALFGKHAKLDHLRVFGCQAYSQICDGQRQKLDPKAAKGVLVGDTISLIVEAIVSTIR